MIRRSIHVAIAAVILSLMLHGLGLNFTARDLPRDVAEGSATDISDVGASFEDFAEVTPPDSPSLPELIETEIPPTLALVASDNPKNVINPDTGTAELIEPNTADLDESDDPAPDGAEQSGGPDETIADTGASPPLETDVVAPETAEDALEEPEEIEIQTIEAADPQPSPETPTELEVQEPEQPDVTIAALPDAPEEAPLEESASVSAVSKSLRPPKGRPENFSGQQKNTQSGTSTGLIESPLAAYKRGGVDPFGGGGGGSGGTGFSSARNVGNAGVTNYAGRVLMKLNRSPLLYRSSYGTAQVSFEINPDGSLAWVRVLRSSGSDDINRAASAQVRSAAPFPPPPGGKSRRMSFVYRNKR
ncbi:Gram-negative bacterial tonB protein [Roseovarius albus]|uniref:Gram-negative bacterial tonB protein n=1 Tax=Roseovarius albus TaxID=1247867 RepID=A0A1X6ZPW7_9RHOB|nr:energy transducer TonB [Roseovarius albus]SLN58155.1 Gram-negative bacterial tonB protein [Roseovarius albus]